MREKNKKLRSAWTIFLALVALFIAAVSAYHSFRKERSSSYQYRILIDENTVVENEETKVEVERETKIDPDEKFYEQTKYGLLPKIAEDGTRPFDAYSACSEIDPKKKLRVVVLIGDCDGINAKIKLINQKVTFVIPYYVDRLESVIKVVKESGHEFFIQIPTQYSVLTDKKRTVSPFLANSEIDETLDKLFGLLASAKYALGIASVSPTLLTKSKKDMTAIAEVLAKRGLAFLDLEKTNDLLQSLSEESGMIYINRTAAFEANDFDVSKLNDGDIVTVRLERLDDLVKALPDDWLLTPVSASVRSQ
jgi:polysaccharide deacetylase 2 family uncharacterized protein YibQ